MGKNLCMTFSETYFRGELDGTFHKACLNSAINVLSQPDKADIDSPIQLLVIFKTENKKDKQQCEYSRFKGLQALLNMTFLYHKYKETC